MPSAVNYWDNLLNDLRLAIITAWPEVGINFLSSQVRRINWLNLITGVGGLMPIPYAVIQVPPAQETEAWAMDTTAFAPQVSLWYIREETGEAVEDAVMERLHAMEVVLGGDGLQADWCMQVLDEYRIDASPENEANSVFIESNYPLYAGAITFTAYIEG